MSVLIKNMEMPLSCHECPFLYVTNICDGFTDCPIVPVPTHGRLIDADTCEPYFYDHLDDLHMIAAQNAIDDMPTIIPAEGGK